MRTILVAAALAAGALCLTQAGQAAGVTLQISCGAVGTELQLCDEGAQAWAKKTGNTVKTVSTPNSSTDRLALYQQLLAAKSSDIDVFQIDVIWPAILSPHFVDLKPLIDPKVLASHFPVIVQADTVGGHLVALPWFTDTGVLYYRNDLLQKYGKPVPTTWADLAATAKAIQDAERKAGAADMQGFVWQGKAYEGLTCNALEWIDSFRGGSIIDDSGKVTVNNPKAAEALDAAAKWIGSISPQGVLNYSEEEARGVFQSGNAVFMRNWPYAWALANAQGSPVAGKVGVAALPMGGADGKHTGALGGWQLAVSKYSKNQEAAVDLVKYLTSAEEQKRRVLAGAFNPTIVSLYQDPEVVAASPFLKSLYDTFTNAVARPSKVTGEKYNQVSSAFYNAVHQTLSGGGTAAANLADLQRQLDRLGRNGKW